jgi:hypothetical protein
LAEEAEAAAVMVKTGEAEVEAVVLVEAVPRDKVMTGERVALRAAEAEAQAVQLLLGLAMAAMAAVV